MRRRFSQAERRALYIGADGRCSSCGADLEGDFHGDHVTPWSRGGTTDVRREFLETPVLEGLGYSIEEVKAAVAHDPEVIKLLALVWDGSPLPKHGGKREKGQGAVSTLKRGSTDREYLIRRLQRDFPEIYARLKAGEFPSARAAAIAAGIIKVETGLDVLHRGWKKATAEERRLFLEEVKGEEGRPDPGVQEDQPPRPRRGAPKAGRRGKPVHGKSRPTHQNGRLQAG